MNSYLIVAILFISALLSGLSVFLVRKDNTTLLKLILSFSGAFLFSITVIHLIPEVYHSRETAPETIGFFILGGFVFQLILEHFSQGIEHGHIHAIPNKAFPLGIMISLCLHAFLEGMPIAAGHQSELVFGIAIHHIPASFALGSLLINASITKNKVIFLLTLFAIMTPLGFLISKFLSHGSYGNISSHFDKIMALVIGIFLHISTTILFESGSANHHVFNRKKMVAIFIGILVAVISLYVV